MKELSLLVWLTQLGLSVAVPLAGFIWLSVWLRQTFELGIWVVIIGVILGFYCAVQGFIQNLRLLDRMHNKKNKESSSVYYNEHN